MCEVITAAAPASTAAANGTSSRAARVSGSTSMRGRSRWLSVAVSPWPGKCLAQAATPVDWSPRVQAATWAATCSGSDAEAAGADDGVVGVAVDVGDRARGRGSTPTAASSCADPAADGLGELQVVGGAEGRGTEHRARLAGVQPGDVAALLVDRDHGAAGWRRGSPASGRRAAAGPSAVLLPKSRCRRDPARAARGSRRAASCRRSRAAAPAARARRRRASSALIPSPPRR